MATPPPPPPTKPPTAFISGPIDASDAYFETHYAPHLATTASANHHFIIGPVRGIDTLALHHLLTHLAVPPAHITVYMASFEYLAPAWRRQYEELGVNVRNVEEAGTTAERDAAMTRDSDYDVLRYRTEVEAKGMYGAGWRERVSNTEMNERRRRGVGSRVYNLGGSVAPERGEGWGGVEGGDMDGGGSGKKDVGRKLKGLFGKREGVRGGYSDPVV